ncbi:hypothetical protein ACX3VE_05120, partial [Escherichia coli]
SEAAQQAQSAQAEAKKKLGAATVALHAAEQQLTLARQQAPAPKPDVPKPDAPKPDVPGVKPAPQPEQPQQPDQPETKPGTPEIKPDVPTPRPDAPKPGTPEVKPGQPEVKPEIKPGVK